MQGPDQKTKCTSFVFLIRPLLYVFIIHFCGHLATATNVFSSQEQVITWILLIRMFSRIRWESGIPPASQQRR
jgi:hypothetical protein